MYIMHCAYNVYIQCMFINKCIVYVKQLCACCETNYMLHVLSKLDACRCLSTIHVSKSCTMHVPA